MKKLSVLFAAIMMMLFVGVANAQKIATMDVATILNQMPEKKKADAQLDAFAKAKKAEIDKKGQSMEATYQKYQQEAKDKSEAENKARMEELQKLQDEVTKLQASAQQELLKKQDEAYAPIEKKFNDAVAKAAQSNGWEYVMDANSSAFVFKNGPDATAAVKKELGL